MGLLMDMEVATAVHVVMVPTFLPSTTLPQVLILSWFVLASFWYVRLISMPKC